MADSRRPAPLPIIINNAARTTRDQKPLLDAGKGGLTRGTESGALLLDLHRHADVAQYAAWANSYGDQGARVFVCRVVERGCVC